VIRDNEMLIAAQSVRPGMQLIARDGALLTVESVLPSGRDVQIAFAPAGPLGASKLTARAQQRLRLFVAPVADCVAASDDDDSLDFGMDAMRPATFTYRTQNDVMAEISREARETGISFRTLLAGSR
jgi:hypothetical protein